MVGAKPPAWAMKAARRAETMARIETTEVLARIIADACPSGDRQSELEEAITEASIALCESNSPEAKKAMEIFNKVMPPEAMKRMGI